MLSYKVILERNKVGLAYSIGYRFSNSLNR